MLACFVTYAAAVEVGLDRQSAARCEGLRVRRPRPRRGASVDQGTAGGPCRAGAVGDTRGSIHTGGTAGSSDSTGESCAATAGAGCEARGKGNTARGLARQRRRTACQGADTGTSDTGMGVSGGTGVESTTAEGVEASSTLCSGGADTSRDASTGSDSGDLDGLYS